MCTVECWYDRHARSWVVWILDADGNQIGEASYFGRKEEAFHYADTICKECGYIRKK